MCPCKTNGKRQKGGSMSKSNDGCGRDLFILFIMIIILVKYPEINDFKLDFLTEKQKMYIFIGIIAFCLLLFVFNVYLINKRKRNKCNRGYNNMDEEIFNDDDDVYDYYDYDDDYYYHRDDNDPIDY